MYSSSLLSHRQINRPNPQKHAGSPFFFSGKGDTSAVFIIQVAGNILIDANLMVKLRKGASAKNIFWQVSGNVKVMSEAHMEGNILCKTDVTFITGSSLNGRILAQTAAVLQKATITKPAL